MMLTITTIAIIVLLRKLMIMIVTTLCTVGNGYVAMQDVMRLYAFSLFLQLLILVPYVIKARHFTQSPRQITLKVLDTLVHAAPPAIPGLMLMCGFAVIVRLKRLGVDLMFPEVLKCAAALEVICFDKTGTLTGSVVCFV